MIRRQVERFSPRWPGLAAVVVGLLWLAQAGGGWTHAQAQAPSPANVVTKNVVDGEQAQDAVATGTIEGRVMFRGLPPDPVLWEVQRETDSCGRRRVVGSLFTTPDGGLADAVVRLHDVRRAPELVPPEEPLTIRFQGCRLEPSVALLPVGGWLELSHEDPMAEVLIGRRNNRETLFHVAFPVAGTRVSKRMYRPGLVTIRSDGGFPFVRGFVYVQDNPYHAITDAEGRFRFEAVPVGRHRLDVWHAGWGARIDDETGELQLPEPRTTRVVVTVREGETSQVEAQLGD